MSRQSPKNMTDGQYKCFKDIPDLTSYPPMKDPNIPPQEVEEFLQEVDELNKLDPVIVDFGGADGKYLRILHRKRPHLLQKYFIIETPQSIKEFSTEDTQERFYENIQDFPTECNLVVCNASLQCHESPYKILDHIQQYLKPTTLLIQRLWNIDNNEYVTVHKFGGYRVPMWVLNKTKLTQYLTEYTLRWEKPSVKMAKFGDFNISNFLFKKEL